MTCIVSCYTQVAHSAHLTKGEKHALRGLIVPHAPFLPVPHRGMEPGFAEFRTVVWNPADGKAAARRRIQRPVGRSFARRAGEPLPAARRPPRPLSRHSTGGKGGKARRGAPARAGERNARGSFLGGGSGAFRPPVLCLHLRAAREETRGVERLGRVAQ